MKASYMNQQYELEELVVNSYPKQITALTEYIKGYERDMQLAAENPKPENGFAGMEIMGEYYTEEGKGGKGNYTSLCSNDRNKRDYIRDIPGLFPHLVLLRYHEPI